MYYIIGPNAGPQLQMTSLPVTTSDRLSSRNLPSLLQQLSEIVTRWRDIGSHLGFTEGELSTIQASPLLLSDGPRGWLREILSQWLERAPGDGQGITDFATLEGLKHSLRQANLGAIAQYLHI